MAHDFTTARINMVENQVRTNDVTDLPIQDSMREAPRERLCLPGKTYLAYAEVEVEYAPGWFLLQPRDVSKLLQAIFPLPGERALAIAAPYAAMVMARMGLKVTLLQPEGEPTRVAQQALEGDGVTVVSGDLAHLDAGKLGGPFNVVISEGAVPVAPKAWIDAIGPGGRMGVVEREGPLGKARLYLRGDDGLPARREVFDCSPPLLKGFEPAPSFTF